MKKTLTGFILCSLMILSAVVPITATTGLKTTTQPLTTGNTLYVGGSGPNNYTKIQDAINDAVNGDTIFVFDDSSPYYENILVDKSVTLIGEDKQTTIIDGNEQGSGVADVVHISADNVIVQKLTIRNGSSESGSQTNYHCGIEIRSDNNIIKDNIIVDNYFGIQFGGLTETLKNDWSKNNVIEGNTIIDNKGAGIHGMYGCDSIITRNNVSLNNKGILLDYEGCNNLVSYNTIFSNSVGIIMSGEKNTTIRQNIIIDNVLGIENWYSNHYTIVENNIFNNEKNAEITTCNIGLIWHWRSNVWDRNYWGEPTQRPVAIRGTCDLVVMNILLINILLSNLPRLQPKQPFSFPMYKLDRNPAQEPYDIPPAGV
jgi:parallel beta-helix repeat protein